MIHQVFRVGPIACNCSILADEQTREAIVVDPGDDISTIHNFLQQNNLHLKQIVVTHAHIDHVAGAAHLRRLTGAPIIMNEADLPLLKMMDVQARWFGVETPEVVPPDIHAKQDLNVTFGQQKGTILHTPGHTMGSICLHLPEQKLLLSGDTLFAGTVGRTDLPCGSVDLLLKSIKEQLLNLPESTRIVPGHGRETDMATELETNPFVQQLLKLT
jgi:glyoxylase-like metal-dependent hydrolase (beta-lactamase superfamily II)